MKTMRLFSIIGTALVGLSVPAWAGPHGAGGGLAGGGHFAGSHFGDYSGGIRTAPTFSRGGMHLNGNESIGGLSRAPVQQFSYYSGARTSAVLPQASARRLPERSISPNIGRAAAVNRQPNRVDPAVGQKRVSNPRLSTAASRQSFVKNHASERHDGNWHRDWDRHHAHFRNHKVFVFINGFWWGLDPWFYPYYANDDYPYDYSGYSDGYPYNDYGYYNPSDYDGQSAYVSSNQYGSSATLSAVQSELAKLGYYRGAIDGVEGDETQAALARYQEDHDLSVTGTLTPGTLQALGLQ